MSKIVVRPANESDDFLQIAHCIYLTDPYIYPAAFGHDPQKASQAMAALMRIKGNLFDYKNIFVACVDTQICGILLCNRFGATWDAQACNTAVQDFVSSLENFENVAKNYFAAASACPSADHIEIVACSVVPAFRQKGVASMMLNRLLAQYPKSTFSLDVLADNPAAIALYTKCGFVQTAQYKGFSIDESKRPNCYHMLRMPYA